MTNSEQRSELGKKTEIIAFSSGKGGTGKTLVATCLGYALKKTGLRILMVDTDIATDGLSLYLLGDSGVDQAENIPLDSTFVGILQQFNEKRDREFQCKPWRINRSAKDDHGVNYEAIISRKRLYGDRFENSWGVVNMQLDQAVYRHTIHQ